MVGLIDIAVNNIENTLTGSDPKLRYKASKDLLTTLNLDKFSISDSTYKSKIKKKAEMKLFNSLDPTNMTKDEEVDKFIDELAFDIESKFVE
jgi:hypothetical protein